MTDHHIDAQAISDALGGKPKAGGGFMACCPAHNDKKPSFSIDTGHNGKPIVNCLAGCSQPEVINALREKGLWPGHDRELSPEDLEAAKLKKAQREAEDREKYAKAAISAKPVLEAATGDPAQHPYALLKRVSFGPLVMRGPWPQRGWDDALLVPLYDIQGNITTVQAINTDGTKDLLKDGQMKGCFHPLGKIHGAAKVLIGEGLATVAAGVHATGLPGVMAVNAGNLKVFATVIRQVNPKAEIIIIADDDPKPDGKNPGKEAAIAAARAVGGKVAIPNFGRKADAWDVFNEQGPEAAKKMIEAARLVEELKNLDAWPKPEPLTAKVEVLPYPVDALPEPIRAAVEEVQAFVKSPVPMVACSALAAVSLAAQALVDSERDKRLTGPASLFFISVADSGERKTSSDKFFTRAIQNYEAEQAEFAKPVIKAYEAELDAWQARRSGLLDAIRAASKAGNNSGDLEATLHELQEKKPVPPRVPRLTYADVTPEALAMNLSKFWPSGGVFSSEGGSVFGSHAMGRDSIMRTFSLYNILWDAEPIQFDRRKDGGSHILRDVRLTVSLQVQETVLRDFFDKSGDLARGSGFLARFLISWPKSTMGDRSFTESPNKWPALAGFHYKITELLNEPLPMDADGRLTPTMLTMTPEAKAAWAAFHNAIESELGYGGELSDVRDVAAKIADNCARLAALFHVFENGLGGEIGPEHLEPAARIVTWHLNESRRFFGEIAMPEELGNAARLDEWLLNYCHQKRKTEVPFGIVQQFGPGPLRNKVTLEAALGKLEELGRARLVKDGKKKNIQVNPALLRGGAS